MCKGSKKYYPGTMTIDGISLCQRKKKRQKL